MGSVENAASCQWPTISGYIVTEEIYSTDKIAIYQAIQTQAGEPKDRPVVIKVLQQKHPSFQDLVRFRHQYAIAKNLPIPGIIRPLSLEPWGNGYALVMEDFGGISLQHYAKNHPLTITQILSIGVQMADILSELGQHSIVHKDIKPANILIHPESLQVKLTDFSISSHLPKETQEMQHPKGLEGTLAYLAPEQTGRMNRCIDYRADFYALGITLYELFTGACPFQFDQPLDLVHAHIAQQATPPHLINTDLPTVVSKIVLKLIAKNAEDRYQSALGLKYDLEQCLHQWKDTGTVQSFALGQRDMSDRFLMPEKLYGRETAVATLLDAFSRVANQNEDAVGAEVVLVAGASGIGKTAVVKEVHKPITHQRGYFIQGKFDQLNRSTPFSAFISAFQGLIEQLLCESDGQLKQWKQSLVQALGTDAQVMVDMLPELANIVGEQPEVTELSGSEAQARFHRVLNQFVGVFARQQHPLVLFLDDLQWADAASLNLLQVLTRPEQSDCLLVLGAYRDNEVFAGHPFMLTLSELHKQKTQVHTLTLSPLAESEVEQLVADAMRCPSDLAKPLAQLMYQQAQGNPFFTTQFLQTLQAQGCLAYDIELGHWQCDLSQIRRQSLTEDVVSFMVSRLQALPAETQRVLKLAACLGNQFELEILAVICEQSIEATAADLWVSLQEGFVIPENETYRFFQQDLAQSATDLAVTCPTVSYRFLHDRVQQAAYLLIAEEQRANIHYEIGQKLLAHLNQQAKEEALFEIVNHLNFGQGLVGQGLSDTSLETTELAQLNLAAGERAIASTAYTAAAKYLESGIAILKADNTHAKCWETAYDLTFGLYQNLCIAQLNDVSYEQLSATILTILTHVSNPVDQAEIYVIQIIQLTISGEYDKAIAAGLSGLKALGIDLDPSQLSEIVQAEFDAINQQLASRSIGSLIELPTAVSPQINATIKLLIAIDPPAYITGKIELYSAVSLQATRLSMEHGNIAESIKAYASCGNLFSLMRSQYQQGYEFGDLALQLSYKLNSKAQRCKAGLLVGGWIQVWAKPIAGAAKINYQSYLAGMESGEPQFAAYNLFAYLFNRVFQGDHLTDISQELDTFWQIAHNTQNELLQVAVAGTQLFTHQLSLTTQEQAQQQAITPDAQARAQATIQQGEASQAWFTVCAHYILSMQSAYILDDLDSGIHYAAAAKNVIAAVAGFTTSSDYPYYSALILLGQYQQFSSAEKATASKTIEAHLQQLKTWANSCPENFLHKYWLVSAEHCRYTGDRLQAIEFYDRAIAHAKTHGFIQEEALANERAAKFYLDWGKEKFALSYLQEAYYGYVRWGAKAKVEQLEQCYRQHLQGMTTLSGTMLSGTLPGTTTNTLASSRTIALGSQNMAHSIGTQPQAWLDLPSVMQAAQALSEEISLEKLLTTLVEITVDNVGAQTGHLLLYTDDEQWLVAATGTHRRSGKGGVKTLNTPLDQYPAVPHKLVHYVARTQETAVFENLSTADPFERDAYVLKSQPKSALCIPICRKGRRVGVLYLENNLTVGAFTSDRIELLQLIAAQAAISIENAQLYQQTENYAQILKQEVAYKTQALDQKAKDLEQALSTLRKTQAQLIHAGKMTSMEQLVAGIAHEINNPITFIKGNLACVQKYLKEITDLLNLYQATYPQPPAAIEALRNEIEIEFITEDVIKLLGSMASGSDRIRQIVLNLRGFSRLDESTSKAANLQEGLNSTLLMLKNQCLPTEHHPEIMVIKDYKPLPAIVCEPRQLNQVFLNVLTNAIEALRLITYPQATNRPPTIRIQTNVTCDEQIRIVIANNGKAIPDETQVHIFDPFFTTKPIGQGTGLGLFISHSIIKKHGGTISVHSKAKEETAFEILLPTTIHLPVTGQRPKIA